MIIKTKIASMLVLIFVAASWLVCGNVYAERAIWVWGMAKDIALNPASQQEFFNFCSSPKGSASNAIKLVFFDAMPYKFDLMAYNNGAELRNFLAAAHSRGIKVEFLGSDTAYATPEGRADGEALVDRVINFNLGTTDPNKRFDGIQYDVEPYLLNSKEAVDLYDWRWDQGIVWNEYMYLLTNCQAKVNAYNAGNNPDMRFGAAIPCWYDTDDPDRPTDPNSIISRVDYIAVMAYRDTASGDNGIIKVAENEMICAASAGKKVYVAVETSHPTGTLDFPKNNTFYEKGNAAMETQLAAVNTAFSGYSSYAGIAVHYYEDLNSLKVSEASYRRLWTSSFPGYAPVVRITSPSPLHNNVWSGSQVYVTWTAYDLDPNDSIEGTIKISHSADNGASWTTIASGLANSGAYLVNLLGLPAGSNNLIKVSATDNSSSLLRGYDISRTPLSISRTVTKTNITDLHLWYESPTSLRLKWTPPSDMPLYYKVYRSVNGGPLTLILNKALVHTYVDTGLSSLNKYRYQIQAVYGDGTAGALSNVSNILIPSSEFALDYFENNEGITYKGPYGTEGSLLYVFDKTSMAEGAQSIAFNYTYKGGWGAILLGQLPVKVDVSPYTAIALWARTNGVTGTGFYIKLLETGRPEGNEEWISKPIAITNAGWTQYILNLSDFKLDSAPAGNNRLDRHNIGSYGMLFKYDTANGVTANGVYFIDAMRFINNGVDIHVVDYPPQGYDFGTLKGTINDHRFRLGPIRIAYRGLASPWTIRLWTKNNPTAPRADANKYAGLKGADNVNYVPLKVWCANYGPAGYAATPPDEENDLYWVNNEAGWFRIPEYNEMNPANVFTWRRLTWTNVSQDATLGNPFNIYLAMDVADAAVPQDYKTTTLTLEYINE